MTAVDVYRNLKNGCLSVRSRESETYGKVLSHVDSLGVVNVEFVIQDGGQERAKQTQRRNVHALVRGERDDSVEIESPVHITYNPFEYEQFVTVDFERQVESAEKVLVDDAGVWAESDGLEYVNNQHED